MISKLWILFEKNIKTIVGLFLKLIGKQLTEEQWQPIMQFAKFCLVGVSNTLITLVIYYTFISINSKLYIVGNAVGFVLSVLNSYFWNSRFVFKSRMKKLRP